MWHGLGVRYGRRMVSDAQVWPFVIAEDDDECQLLFAYLTCLVPKYVFIIHAFFFVLCFIATPFLTSKVTTFLV